MANPIFKGDKAVMIESMDLTQDESTLLYTYVHNNIESGNLLWKDINHWTERICRNIIKDMQIKYRGRLL